MWDYFQLHFKCGMKLICWLTDSPDGIQDLYNIYDEALCDNHYTRSSALHLTLLLYIRNKICSNLLKCTLYCFTVFVPFINPLQPDVASLYPLETSENLRVFWCFQEYREATLGCNGLIIGHDLICTTRKSSGK